MIKLRFNWKVLTIAFFTLLSSCEKDPELSNEALITNFSFGGVTATISGNTITASVPYGTDITNVAPQIAVSAGATITPASGLARDFSSPLTYTVTAEDGQTTTTFTVTITVLDPDTVVISGFA
ncbi:MAG: hypothetical protein RLZZ241_1255, partial [Bacteroidota bacterium]